LSLPVVTGIRISFAFGRLFSEKLTSPFQLVEVVVTPSLFGWAGIFPREWVFRLGMINCFLPPPITSSFFTYQFFRFRLLYVSSIAPSFTSFLLFLPSNNIVSFPCCRPSARNESVFSFLTPHLVHNRRRFSAMLSPPPPFCMIRRSLWDLNPSFNFLPNTDR